MQPPAITTDIATRDRPVFPGKTLRVCADRPALLRARDGLLWVTFETTQETGTRRDWDYFLHRGQCMRLEPGESVVVGPSDARRGMASFDVEPIAMLRPSRTAWWMRFASMLPAFPRLAAA